MARIAKSLVELVGNTPLLELSKYSRINCLDVRLLAKLEYFNPGGSVKDRIGLAMIRDAEEKGLLNKDSVIIEPTSGNTGIGLAMVAAARGYRLILTMPESFSIERRHLLRALGAEVVLSPADGGMDGAVKMATELAARTPGSYIPQQFNNPANPAVHRETTAEEIWRDTCGQIDIFVSGVGTGGTITGIAEALKSKNPNVRIVAVEPFDSPLLSGGKSGPHGIEGIGTNFIPKVLKQDLLDEVLPIRDEEAFRTARLLAKTEGLLVGISSGAAVFAAAKIAKRPENQGKLMVALLPDTGERYLSTPLFNEE